MNRNSILSINNQTITVYNLYCEQINDCHMSATFMIPSNHNTLYHFRLLHGGAAAVVVGMMVGRHVAPASIGSTAEERDLLLYSPNAEGVVAVVVAPC